MGIERPAHADPVGALRCGGREIASLEVAGDRATRRRGLLGRSSLDGGLWLEPCRAVHTLGMRFAIDVAHCRRVGARAEASAGSSWWEVVRMTTMAPGRLGRPCWRARAVLEAPAGALADRGVEVGDVLEVVP